MLLSEWCKRFGAGMLVPLQGAAVRVSRVLWSWPAGAGGGCRWRVLLQGAVSGAAVRVACAVALVQALRGAAVRAMWGFWSCNESGDDWRNAFWDTFLGCIFLGWPECKKYTFSPYFLHAGQPRKMHPKNAFFCGEMRKSNKQNQVTAKLADGPRIWGG